MYQQLVNLLILQKNFSRKIFKQLPKNRMRCRLKTLSKIYNNANVKVSSSHPPKKNIKQHQ